jgi:outer membrane receptor for ferric coprogen and ferric-rhodotorulic acid
MPRLLTTLVAVALPLTAAFAQTVAPPATTPARDAKEETLVLSPFTVDESSDVGYAATSTLGGTRLKSELRDVASQIDVMTKEFLDDVGALTLDEALRFSMNTETNEENFTPGTDPNTNGVFSSAYGSRTRGLSRSNNTHDFFETNVPIDTYNTGKRFTLVSGSNAILFGAGFAGGTNDVSFERPDLRRFSGNTTVRVDSNRGIRGSLNLNQPLIRNVLGLRLAGLKTDEKDYREGVGSKTDRFYGSLLLQPSRHFGIRGWYERYDSKQRNAANTLVADRVSPWLAAGRPLFNNAGLTATARRRNTTPRSTPRAPPSPRPRNA